MWDVRMIFQWVGGVGGRRRCVVEVDMDVDVDVDGEVWLEKEV